MRVLGLDPSLSNFGWSIYDSSEIGGSSLPLRGRFQTSAKTVFIDRYIDLRSRLRKLIQEHQPDKVACEYPIFQAIYSEGMYGLFLFTCEAIKEERKDVVFFSPGQVKAHAKLFLNRPKSWKMEKPDMVEAAQKAVLPAKGKWNHNEADAFWVAFSGFRFWSFLAGETTDLSLVEKKQFTEIKQTRNGVDKRSGIMYRENERFFNWSQTNG